MADGKVVFDADNPEWTEADFARAVPFDKAPTHIRAAFAKRKPGRPEGADKERITIRLDKDLLAKWRATGAGWQTRLNDALRKVPV